MRQTLKVFSIGMHVVMRDAIMLFLIPAPLLVGITFYYLLPWLNQLLLERFGFSFEEWYPLADGLMIILTVIIRLHRPNNFTILWLESDFQHSGDFYVRLGLLVGLVFLSFRSPLSLPVHFSLSYSAVALQS